MAYMNSEEKKAQDFIDKIKRMLAAKDGLIYKVEERVHKSNVISPSTVGVRYGEVYVTFYNVSDPDTIFNRHQWQRLGQMGVDVDTWTTGSYGSKYSSMEFNKKFSP